MVVVDGDGTGYKVDGAAADALECSDNQFPCHLPRSPHRGTSAQFDPFHYFFHSVSLVSFPPKQKNDEGIGVGRGAF